MSLHLIYLNNFYLQTGIISFPTVTSPNQEELTPLESALKNITYLNDTIAKLELETIAFLQLEEALKSPSTLQNRLKIGIGYLAKVYELDSKHLIIPGAQSDKGRDACLTKAKEYLKGLTSPLAKLYYAKALLLLGEYSEAKKIAASLKNVKEGHYIYNKACQMLGTTPPKNPVLIQAGYYEGVFLLHQAGKEQASGEKQKAEETLNAAKEILIEKELIALQLLLADVYWARRDATKAMSLLEKIKPLTSVYPLWRLFQDQFFLNEVSNYSKTKAAILLKKGGRPSLFNKLVQDQCQKMVQNKIDHLQDGLKNLRPDSLKL